MGHTTAAPDQTIAVFRALQLGDMLCTVPALRALRAGRSNARITLIGLPWAASFAARFSRYIDDFIAFPGWPGLPEQPPRLSEIPAFLEETQARRFDLAIQMHGAGIITNPITALLGATRMAGYFLPGQFGEGQEGFFPHPAGGHEIHTFVRLMEHLGMPAQGDGLEFPVSEVERNEFEAFRASHGLQPREYVVLHPGARFAGRRLPPETFAQVGDRLADMGLTVALTGSKEEAALTQAVARRMRRPALDAAGKTSLGALALLLENALLLVSNDTGVSHIAAAVGARSLILFTASDPRRWQPLNHQLHHALLDALDAPVEQVIEKAASLVKEARRYAGNPL